MNRYDNPGNHDHPDVVIINEWLDSLPSHRAWWAFVAYMVRAVWLGRTEADAWLLESAILSGVGDHD